MLLLQGLRLWAGGPTEGSSLSTSTLGASIMGLKTGPASKGWASRVFELVFLRSGTLSGLGWLVVFSPGPDSWRPGLCNCESHPLPPLKSGCETAGLFGAASASSSPGEMGELSQLSSSWTCIRSTVITGYDYICVEALRSLSPDGRMVTLINSARLGDLNRGSSLAGVRTGCSLFPQCGLIIGARKATILSIKTVAALHWWNNHLRQLAVPGVGPSFPECMLLETFNVHGRRRIFILPSPWLSSGVFLEESSRIGLLLAVDDTTVLCAFILLAAFLAALNVPLSAYEVVQEFTSRPNDTLSPLPFSNMIPEMLQHPTGGFTPKILTVGDKFNLNNSGFDWTITRAFDELQNSQPVPSFSYYNNPFSDGCDVTKMTIRLTADISENSTGWEMQYTVDVTCHIPTLFTLSSNGGSAGGGGNSADYDHNGFTWSLLLFPSFRDREPDTFEITVQPCCDCAATSAELPTQAPCRLSPARFSRVDGMDSYFGYHGAVYGWPPSDGLRLIPGDDPFSAALNTMFLNTFQSLYHLVRLELGLILENQIYASAEMYNRSIAPVYVTGINLLPLVNGSLASTSNATVMAEWRDTVRVFNESDRVPVMLYLRSVPRLKPLGSAITSVFVSTFAMLSVLWTIFSLIAGALARSQSDTTHDQNDGPSILRTSRNREGRKIAIEEFEVVAEWDGSEASLFAPEKEDKVSKTWFEHLSLTSEKNSIRTSIAIAEIQLTLARMGLALRKHGILARSDDKNRSDVEDDLTVAPACRQRKYQLQQIADKRAQHTTVKFLKVDIYVHRAATIVVVGTFFEEFYAVPTYRTRRAIHFRRAKASEFPVWLLLPDLLLPAISPHRGSLASSSVNFSALKSPVRSAAQSNIVLGVHL
ncbi:hypothetical protein DFH09DRAFT_1105628 [Mycena vulgaris]|nr:hypothetical protein DFH09DRAFT_1105628 [Mycena vulgaris]